MSKNSTPKRKRMKRDKRLLSAKNWVENYEGNKIVKAYTKWFGVDFICAIKELRMLNVKISKEYEKGIRSTIESKNKKKSTLAKSSNPLNFKGVQGIDFDENFDTIIGFTSGGAPFGITHEELKNPEVDEFD